ncbi:MAG: MltA domain-containing protein [Alphaproteobacteria bacterium]
MKRVITRVILVLLFIFNPSTGYLKTDLSKELLILEANEIYNFRNNFKKICSSKKFFHNLKNHDSYPSFGTIQIWKRKCDFLKGSNGTNFRGFLINNFKFTKLAAKPGLLTGYYEPSINVSRIKDNKYKYPVLKKHKKFFNESREKIEKMYDVEDVLLWTDDKINLFFLHIQGSGLGKFRNNQVIKISYNGNNGLPYTSIGKYLNKHKLIKNSNINLFSIKEWLRNNPEISRDVLNLNKRFIFFKTGETKIDAHAVGAAGFPLTANDSIAIDKRIYPLGLPFIIKFFDKKAIRPVLSLDTGSAIVGPNRADLFTGRGGMAEKIAGTLKKKIYLYSVIPYDQ